MPPVAPDDHIQGVASARITLVEYGDYQCPYCGVAYPIVKQVQRYFGSRLRFVFRHFPLRQLHPCAFTAAETAEFAASEGAFWVMHDRLYENQQNLEPAGLRDSVVSLGLDAAAWELSLRSLTFEPRIRRDVYSGIDSGVDGTPTFFINGEKHDGSFDFRSLVGAIEAAMGE